MRPTVTAIIAAIEAIAVALAGLVVVAIPALLLWTVSFGLAAEPGEVIAGTTGVWLLAHFVPLTFALTPEAALGLGLAPEALKFTLSLAPLGLTLITVLLAARSGWRFAKRGGLGIAGVLGGSAGFAGVVFAVVPLAGSRIAWTAPLAILVPALVFAVPSLAAFLVRAGRDDHPWWATVVRWKQRGLENLGVPGTAALPARLAETLRLAAALFAAFFGLAALWFTVAIIAGYVAITALTQGLQLDPLGALLLFLLQLALLPTALIWGASWLTGAGFAVGAGSSASPFEALLGPMPALPLFGAIPQGWGGAGVIAPALIILTGVGIGALFVRRSLFRRSSWVVAVSVTLGAVVLVGLVIAGVMALATGSIGPDRLAVTGPEPWLVAGLAAAELGIGALLGVAAGRIDVARLGSYFGVADSSVPHELDGAFDEAFEGGFETAGPSESADLGPEDNPERPDAESAAVESHEHPTEPLNADGFFETSELSDTVEFIDARMLSEATAEEPDVEAASTTAGNDPLLRAFEWDGSETHAEDPVDEPRRGWRWPHRDSE